MRMWMVDPKIMCRQHLLGEHVEIHMFISTIDHGKQVKGYLENELLEIHNLYPRHEALVKEMEKRGYQHTSDVDIKWKSVYSSGLIDSKKSLEELLRRCPRCRNRYLEAIASR